MDTPRTATITMRVRNALKKRLEKMARSTGRSRSFLATEAISAYLDDNQWQIRNRVRALFARSRRRHPAPTRQAMGRIVGDEP